MDTHKKIREHISALSDGALPSDDVELAFAALQGPDGGQAWELYHRIGDVLRNQATPELSDGFGARLAARLAAEPAPGKRQARASGAGAGRGSRKRARAASSAPSAPLAPAPLAAADARDDTSLDAKAVVNPKPAIASVS